MAAAAATAVRPFLSDGWATLFIYAHTQAAFIAAYSSSAIDTSARVNGGWGARLRLFQTHAADNGEQPEWERRARRRRISAACWRDLLNAAHAWNIFARITLGHFILSARARAAAVSASHFFSRSLSDFNSSGPDCIPADDSRLHYYFVESKKCARSKLGKFACWDRSSQVISGDASLAKFFISLLELTRKDLLMGWWREPFYPMHSTIRKEI